MHSVAGLARRNQCRSRSLVGTSILHRILHLFLLVVPDGPSHECFRGSKTRGQLALREWQGARPLCAMHDGKRDDMPTEISARPWPCRHGGMTLARRRIFWFGAAPRCFSIRASRLESGEICLQLCAVQCAVDGCAPPQPHSKISTTSISWNCRLGTAGCAAPQGQESHR